MIHEALDAVEAVLIGAVIAVGIITAGIAFLTAAAGYWTAVLIGWAIRTTTHRNHQPDESRKETS